MDLVRQSAVVRIDVEAGGKGVWRITGEVQGTQYEPYSLSVSLVLAPNGTGWLASDAGLQAFSAAATASTPSSHGAAQ